MDYFIAVSVPRIADAPVLAKALQAAYDDAGAAGFFHIIDVADSHQLVQFCRNSAEDAEYIANRIGAFSADIGQAAAEQLASELEDAPEMSLITPIVEALKSGRGTVFEFGLAGLEGLRQTLQEPA